jgi:hypothetical protein
VAEKEYRRLTRSSARKGQLTAFATRESLWLGKDHLLSITSNRFTEEYKRFYFQDIQAITIRKTRRREIWNLILSLALLLCLGFLISDFRLTGLSVLLLPWGIPSVLVALPLLFNNLLGPACTCYIRTAVQVEELASMNRVRRVRRILERIHPLIAAAQGELTADQLADGLHGLAREDLASQAARRMDMTPLNLS